MTEVAENIRPVAIEEEMRSSYLDYAMSVIVSRALPDVRDGLKPVHRRILYAMHELGMRSDSPYRKSARVVGEVLGKYHPHGDTAVYDAMVRLAQDFSMRYPLVDGQGNFGSVDADPPAAMRYTEVRLAPPAEEVLAEIDQATVDFVPNFDASLNEPTVLPARLPNLLVNGASGIAVGMATNIPPHNLAEVCDAIAHLIDHPEAAVEELMQFIPGPDFPTAGIVRGREGIVKAYSSGHGRIVVQARARIEEGRGDHRQIVVTELPYQVNKAALIERIADLVKKRRIEGITDLRDESDRTGMRAVIELRREAQPRQVLNALYKYTAMQSAFFVNMLALVNGEPRVLSLKAALQHYIAHRQEVVARRSRHELQQARERAHILEGLNIALDHLDEAIAIIRRSRTAESARAGLMAELHLSQVQAQAVLDMPLRRLAALEQRRLRDEYANLMKRIAYLEDLLASPRKLLSVVKDEVAALREKYGDGRRTLISDEEAAVLTEEDLTPHGDVVVTLTQSGRIKRLPVGTYRAQSRGGRGISSVPLREDDAVVDSLVADTHHSLLFFTNRGRVYCLRHAYDVADSTRQARGTPLSNLVSLDRGEQVTTLLGVPNFEDVQFLAMVTRKGDVKRTPLAEFAAVRSNGLICMNLEDGDDLVAARMVGEADDLILVTEKGQAARIHVADVPVRSRPAGGVIGLRLGAGDQVVAMDVPSHGQHLLVLTADGFGKRTALGAYPTKRRPWAGVRTFAITKQTGPVAVARVVGADQEAVIASSGGHVIRTAIDQIPVHSRATRGVTIMKPEAEERIVALALLQGEPQASARASRRTAPPAT